MNTETTFAYRWRLALPWVYALTFLLVVQAASAIGGTASQVVANIAIPFTVIILLMHLVIGVIDWCAPGDANQIRTATATLALFGAMLGLIGVFTTLHAPSVVVMLCAICALLLLNHALRHSS